MTFPTSDDLRRRANGLRRALHSTDPLVQNLLSTCADDLDLLADLSDAIGNPAILRTLASAFDLPYLDRIAAILDPQDGEHG